MAPPLVPALLSIKYEYIIEISEFWTANPPPYLIAVLLMNEVLLII
jgi:hypothetical protein